jgi:rod shape-determining protein MreC
VARTRRSRRPRLTIGLLVLASITIITLDYRGDAHGAIASLKNGASDAFHPVQSGVDAVTHPIGSFLAGAVNGGQLEQENAKLRTEVGQLQRQTLAEQATQNALKSIVELNHLPFTGSIPTVAATVINLNPSNFEATVELNKGTADGVDVGMPVVAGAGLVGQVIATSSSTCTVRLITDGSGAGQGVGVRYGPSSTDIALAQGAGIGKPLVISDVTPGAALHKGEILTTSGLQNAAYPQLIPVARVTGVSSTPSSTEESVTAVPVADLTQLDYVEVLQWPAVP